MHCAGQGHIGLPKYVMSDERRLHSNSSMSDVKTKLTSDLSVGTFASSSRYLSLAFHFFHTMSARNKDDLPENTDSPTLGPSGINHTETRSLETVRDDGSTVFTDIGRPWQMPLYISEADGVSVQNEPGQSRLSNMTTSTKFTDLPERLERNSEQNEQPGQISANITDPSTAQTTGLHNRESSSRELSAHIEAGGFYYDNSSAASDISGGQTTQISQVPRRDPFHIPYDNNR